MEIAIYLIIFVYFQCFLCIFALFSHILFIYFTVFDVKVEAIGRYHMLLQSFGYLLVVSSFLSAIYYCWIAGHIEACITDNNIFKLLQLFGKSFIVMFHLLLNSDRLQIVLFPYETPPLTAKVLFVVVEILVYISIGLYIFLTVYKDDWWLAALVPLIVACTLNALIVYILHGFSEQIFLKTRGTIPLGKRFDLYQSLKIIRSFLPASIFDFCLQSIYYTLYISSRLLVHNEYLAIMIFVIEFFWILDCAGFPWFFLMKNSKVRIILKKNIRFANFKVEQTNMDIDGQDDHFKRLQEAWKH